jgi:hypothetical protein
MKPIELNKIQKEHLLEMCRKLFPEFNKGKNFYFKNHLDLPGEYENSIDELTEINTNFVAYYCFGQKLLNNESAEDHMSKWFGEIHWFEFVTTYLLDKLYPDNNKQTSGSIDITDKEIVLSHIFIDKDHPIDYLYEQFLKIK